MRSQHASVTGAQHPSSGSSASATSGPGTTGVAASSTAAGSNGASAAGSSSAGASSAGWSSSGASTSSSGNGTTIGASTRGVDPGRRPCLPLGTGCASNAGCCSGSCDVTCLEPEGQHCSGPSDYTSDNCIGTECRCESNSGATRAACGVSADCCDGFKCAHVLDDAGTAQTGTCCDPTVTRCQSDSDCCGTICVNQHCGCLTANDEGCSSCSVTSGPCSTSSDCCGAGICADFSQGPSVYYPSTSFTDAGKACCEPTGGAGDSDAGYSGNFTCCSGVCTSFACACDAPGDTCYDDQSCCSGGVCLPRFSSGGGQLACCVPVAPAVCA